MPHTSTPWLGLVALLAMFLLPFLPSWLFEGPRTVRHWPRRHVCGYCSAPWTRGHVCEFEAIEAGPPMVVEAGPPMVVEAGGPLHGELRRLAPPAAGELEPPPEARILR